MVREHSKSEPPRESQAAARSEPLANEGLTYQEAEALLHQLAHSSVPVHPRSLQRANIQSATKGDQADAPANRPNTAGPRDGSLTYLPVKKPVLAEDLFRDLLEAAPDAMVVIDQQGMIVLVNSQTEKLFQYRREDLIGQAIERLVPERFRTHHVQYRTDYFAAPRRRPIGVGQELFGRRQDGEEIPVEISLSPLAIDEGFLVISTIRDLTERKRSEAQLRKAEARYRTLVEEIPAVTFMAALDESSHELYVSPQIEALLGFSQQEWIDNPILWYTQLHPEDRERWHHEFARTCSRGEHFRAEYRFLSRTGEVVWVHGEAKLVRDDDGRPLFLQGVAFDITGMKRAEEKLKELNQTLEERVAERTAVAEEKARELERSNTALDDFAYAASHDLREPLRTMWAYTNRLAKRLAGQLDAAGTDDIERTINGARRMERLIEDLYFYSQVGREGKPEPVDCNRLVEQVRENLREAIQESQAEVTADPLPRVMGVETHLVRLFQNLIQNAIKFRGNRPIQVHISAEQQNGEWLFRVRDTGIGIDSQDLARLFKKIGQEARLHSRSKYPGTGFGLAICKKIVERGGGRIGVESEPGRGSTFLFTLPVTEDSVTS